MTTQRLIQNFRGMRGVLWGGPAMAVDTLQATLARLGLTPARMQDIDPKALDCNRDVLFVDGDCNLDAALIGCADGDLPRAPAVGLVGVEAPSRLRALSDIGVTAFLRKPVHAAAVYSSLFLAVNGYRKMRVLELQLAEHDRRRRGRRFVIKAVVHLMRTSGVTDDEAYALLRRDSMRLRMGIEDYAETLALQSGALQSSAPLAVAADTSDLTQEKADGTRPDDDCCRYGDGRDAGGADDGDPGGGADQTRCA
jgi:AmiR/NasT family two-component response regulator